MVIYFYFFAPENTRRARLVRKWCVEGEVKVKIGRDKSGKRHDSLAAVSDQNYLSFGRCHQRTATALVEVPLLSW